MARPEINPPVRDALDSLFEPDESVGDMFATIRRDKEAEVDSSTRPGEVIYGKKKDKADDVDDEIKITKKRAPIAKLDEAR